MSSRNAKLKPAPSASRRRAYAVLTLAALVLLGLAAWGVAAGWHALDGAYDEQCRIADADLDVVITNTGRMVHPDLVTRFFGLTNGANLATLDFAARRRELLARVPNIRDLRIERRMPNRVTVEIIERTPVARLAAAVPQAMPDGRVVDADGVVFRFARTAADLPIVRDATQPALRPGQHVAGATAAALQLVCTLRDAHDLGELRVLDVAASSRSEYLVLTLGNYSRAKIAWEHMDRNDARAHASLSRQLWRLARAVETHLTPGTTLWNVLDYADDGRVYANDPTLSARQKGS